MNVAQVQQAVDIWALNKILEVARSQVQQVVRAAPAHLEPHKGTRIDVRV
ncbi:hypothetical protein J2Z79_000402 [Symbiobacterium terraclitae]|uniref:Uncharacterized protein n=1 Tax=Symbiobacterium terraclitae TaxID=557451 RepID=A0ABS4JNB9_9FIRM|nr:YjfB family protein [Symbiobacterium terraclitae]MBP2017028.1 hypothetical protein [Symbiobacterium terraclitae]